MSSPNTSASSFFDSLKRAASPLIDKLKFVLSPVATRSAPVSPTVSPTKQRTQRAPKTISSSLREKNKIISIGKPLQKVYKVPSSIGKKKQPKMACVKQLKIPKELVKKPKDNYLNEAFNNCKKDGKLLAKPKLQAPRTNQNGSAAVTPQNIVEQMDIDNAIPHPRPIPFETNSRTSKSRLKLFSIPDEDADPECLTKFQFPKNSEQAVPCGSLNEALHGAEIWTQEHRSEKFVFD